MAKQSAGILAYRVNDDVLEVFLVHPGGPFWKNKDAGAWSIPKGEFNDNEEPLSAARREFEEETGQSIAGDFIELKPVKLKSGKTVYAWAVAAEVDENSIQSNTFELEWPPRSGKMIQVPEIDQAGWFDVPAAMEKINPAQMALIDELAKLLKANS
ncbi:NUDIX domain-containing protein [Mucilaginibacter mali]|uniref:NUDIX domain-containing protein n=1 Tax=Mucilaginibacter mali TaxID=2740462 RepID=A0A7D4Q999_9SPHI|nr:NUDIX domain-containing protein [Mucilaginibacter mali]QKJ30005.1 NUDIX domain-containing protein [Mucilaginibacter mali]